MTRLAVNLLGGFHVALESGAPVAISTKKARALLAYLALEPGRRHCRDALSALLWGERAGVQARKSLREAVYMLRKELRQAGAPLVIVEGDDVAVDGRMVQVDAARFARLATEATTAALEGAAALYRGDFLDGFSVDEPAFEEWLATERQRLREMAIDILARLLAHQTRAATTERGIQTAVRLLALDPLQESAHRTLMRLYVRQGRRTAALRQYQMCVDLLQRELRTRPETETTRLYEEILRPRRNGCEEADRVLSSESSPVAGTRSREAVGLVGTPPALPDRPSIAVLPFATVGQDPANDALADGLSVEVIRTLSQISGLFVIATTSVFTYKGRAVNVHDVGRELGVRHVLEGSVQRSGGRVRVTAQLVDATAGCQVWAERFDRTSTDVFTLQDDIAQRIVTELEVTLTEGEQARRRRRTTSNVEALEHWARGLAAYRQTSREANALARAEFEHAVAIDSDFAAAKVLLGWTHFSDAWQSYTADRPRSTAAAEALARDALALDPDLPDAHTLVAGVHLLHGRREEALAAARRGVDLDPNAADLHAYLANVLTVCDRFDEALAAIATAMRLSPVYPGWYLIIAAVACRNTGRVDEARAAYAAAKAAMPENAVPRIGLMLCHMMSGHESEARAEMAEWRARDANVSLERVRAMTAGFSPARRVAVLDLVRRAGLT